MNGKDIRIHKSIVPDASTMRKSIVSDDVLDDVFARVEIDEAVVVRGVYWYKFT